MSYRKPSILNKSHCSKTPPKENKCQQTPEIDLIHQTKKEMSIEVFTAKATELRELLPKVKEASLDLRSFKVLSELFDEVRNNCVCLLEARNIKYLELFKYLLEKGYLDHHSLFSKKDLEKLCSNSRKDLFARTMLGKCLQETFAAMHSSVSRFARKFKEWLDIVRINYIANLNLLAKLDRQLEDIFSYLTLVEEEIAWAAARNKSIAEQDWFC